jgi:hypothetical protein
MYVCDIDIIYIYIFSLSIIHTYIYTYIDIHVKSAHFCGSSIRVIEIFETRFRRFQGLTQSLNTPRVLWQRLIFGGGPGYEAPVDMISR